MSFLHPGFLALTALFSVPLLIHLLNRRRYQVRAWAAMEFLLRAFRENRRRLRMENLLLLLLRCLIPVLLALAIARPRLGGGGGNLADHGLGKHHILVLDRSYSMGVLGPGGIRPFDRALRQVRDLAAEVSRQRGNRLSLVLMDGRATVPLRGTLDLPASRKALLSLEGPSDGRAVYLPVLDQVRELASAFEEPAVLHWWSDFQIRDLSGATPPSPSPTGKPKSGSSGPLTETIVDAYRDLLDAGVEVHFHPVRPTGKDLENASVASLSLDPGNAIVDSICNLRVVLAFRGRTPRGTTIRLLIDGKEPRTRSVTLRPGREVEVDFPIRFRTEGDHLLSAVLEGDALPADDRRDFVVRARKRIRILLVKGGEEEEDPILSRAFLFEKLCRPDPTAKDPGLLVFDPVTITEDRFQADPGMIDPFDVVALIDVSGPRERAAVRLERWVRSGGGLLIVPGPDSVADLYNLRLFGKRGDRGPLPLRLLSPRGETRRLEDPDPGIRPRILDVDSPLLSDFTEGGLGKILEATPINRYWGVSTLDAPETTSVPVGIFDPSAASEREVLLAERSYGRGRAILLTSNLSRRPDRWNHLDDLWISLPLIHSIMHRLAARDPGERNLTVGDPLSTWFAKIPSTVSLLDPAGERNPLPLPDPASGDPFKGWILPPYKGTWRSGPYRLEIRWARPSLDEETRLFALRPDTREGDLSYVDAKLLAREIPGSRILEGLTLGDRTETSAAGSGELGRFLLLATLGFAVIEALLAGLLGRRRL